MKCSNCGCEDFYEVDLIDSTNLSWDAGQVFQNVDAYACKNCGHVELFIPNEDLNELKEEERREKEEKAQKEKMINEINSRLEELDNIIEKCSQIINDENQTVKDVRNAQVELNDALKEKALLGMKLIGKSLLD